VPQDTADESASVLLERIREQRTVVAQDAGQKRPKGRRRESKKDEPVMAKTRKEIKPTHLQDILRASNGGMAPEALWKISELDIDDFYKQLRDEVAAGQVREQRDGGTSRLICQ
jgi:type I restriction enzyme S subunit